MDDLREKSITMPTDRQTDRQADGEIQLTGGWVPITVAGCHCLHFRVLNASILQSSFCCLTTHLCSRVEEGGGAKTTHTHTMH